MEYFALTKLHSVIKKWKDNLPGEYEHFASSNSEQRATGYNWVNLNSVREDFVDSIDEYICIYSKIKNINEKMCKRII